MDDFLPPRESAEFIVNSAEDSCGISIDNSAVDRVANLIFDALLAGNLGQLDFAACEVHPSSLSDRRSVVDWIFFINSINFSFWSAPGAPYFEITHNGKKYSGYYAACAAVNRALQRGVPLTDANFMAKIEAPQLAEIFTSDNGSIIPLLEERVQAIRENGRILLEHFEGSIYNCLKSCDRRAQEFLKVLIEYFPSFRDGAEFKGRKVSFLKRAQILVADIHSYFRDNLPVGLFYDIGSLTMFADYRVPQALAFLGVLKYTEAFKQQFKEQIESGSEVEVLLRGYSIFACDRIVDRIEELRVEVEGKGIKDKLRNLTAVDVDVFLWLYRREHAEEIEERVPFHRCRCIYY